MQSRGLAIIGCCLISGVSWAQKKDVKPAKPAKPTQEVTTIVGEASGLGARYWLNYNMALDVRAEFELFPVSTVVLNSAFHLSFAEIARKEGRPLPVYVGAGVKLGGAIEEQSFVFGASAPIGAGLPLGKSAATAFLEFAPGFLVLQGEPILDLDACLGIRYSLPAKKETPPPTKKK